MISEINLQNREAADYVRSQMDRRFANTADCIRRFFLL